MSFKTRDLTVQLELGMQHQEVIDTLCCPCRSTPVPERQEETDLAGITALRRQLRTSLTDTN